MRRRVMDKVCGGYMEGRGDGGGAGAGAGGGGGGGVSVGGR